MIATAARKWLRIAGVVARGLTKGISLGLAGVMLMGLLAGIWSVRWPIETAEYPSILEACRQAQGMEKTAMLEVVRERAGKGEVFNLNSRERDRMLSGGGYCLPGGTNQNCRPLPIGKEGEGIAMEIMYRGSCEAQKSNVICVNAPEGSC